jgi:hypothetical protein
MYTYIYIYINRHTQIIQPIVSTSSKALAAATSAWHRWPSGEMWPKTAILHENSILSTKNQWHVNLMIIYIYIIIYIIKSTTYFIYICYAYNWSNKDGWTSGFNPPKKGMSSNTHADSVNKKWELITKRSKNLQRTMTFPIKNMVVSSRAPVKLPD